MGRVEVTGPGATHSVGALVRADRLRGQGGRIAQESRNGMPLEYTPAADYGALGRAGGG